MIRNDDAMQALFQRYAAPGRRYLKLGVSLLHMEPEAYEAFGRDLAADARGISDDDLAVMLEGSWRERRTAAWFAAVSRREHVRERLGVLLLESEVCCAGLAYCVALASFATSRDAELLVSYLERYLRRPDLGYDQPVAMGALAHLDAVLGADRTGPLLREDGLWTLWFNDAAHMHGDPVISPYLSLVRDLCAVVDDCSTL
ncbi:DUF6000 family protein [Streptomyces sp. NPDC001941]|uniref:DUF6000 family protein n=1 Tax=Streptomyces sp. NPDC001941 TaxID=3154659 RepID=UPI00332B71E5